MAAPMVKSTVTLRTGEKQEFSHQIQSSGNVITYDKLQESIQIIQKELNEYLTVQVDRERGLNDGNNDDTAEEGDEEEDNEDEENENEGGVNRQGRGDQEPPAKKPKK